MYKRHVLCDFIHYPRLSKRNKEEDFKKIKSIVVEDEEWFYVVSKDKHLVYYTTTNWCTWRNLRTFWNEKIIQLESSLIHIVDKEWKSLCNSWEWY